MQVPWSQVAALCNRRLLPWVLSVRTRLLLEVLNGEGM